MQGIGLAVMLIGLQMAFVMEHIIIGLLSLLTGAIVGEWLQLESGLDRLGKWVGNKLGSEENDSRVSQGFVTASLIFVIGAMSIIGALDSGLRGDHEVLITKGILDGFVALVLTTTLGLGVILSVFPVLLYQGSIALLATQIEGVLPESTLNGFITELTGVGGLLIVAIGLNLLNITSIRIGNLLPAIIMVGVIYYVYQLFL
ncbi:membrane protein [Virgibacillus pantothenticus]|nr:membrane protein [Virgibacillus pantothenticus]